MIQGVFLSQTEYQNLTGKIDSFEKRLDQVEKNTLEWVTVEQACELLNRSKNTVYALCESGEIVKKQGKRKIEISMKSIREYNEKHTIKS